jgi:hypothetical protein
VNRIHEQVYQFDGAGRRYHGRKKLHEVEMYQLVAMNHCQRAKPAEWIPREAYQPKLGKGLIVIELDFFLGRDIDCDNTQKVILDGIKFGLGTHIVVAKRTKNPSVRPLYDDNRFLGRAMSKVTGVKHPRVEVTIRG